MSSVAPGWYNDVDNPALIRWWDGDAWTVHTHPHPAAAPKSPSSPEPARSDARDSESPSLPAPEPERVVAPAWPSFPVSEPVRLVPPTSPVTAASPPGWQSSDSSVPDWARSDSSNRSVTGVTTAGSWMLALLPVIALGLLALGWLLTDGATASSTSIVGILLAFALLAWVIIATIADFRRLGALGHKYRPSVLWILLGPLMYLIARAIHVVRTTGRGAAPTWVYAVLSILVGAALGAISLVFPREASLAELRAVESTIVADLQQQGFDYSVICPDEVTLVLGSTFVCTAYDEVGPALLLRVSYGGVPGLFSYDVESSSAGA